QVEDDRHGILEPVGDLLRVVEAARDDEVDTRGDGAGYGTRTQDRRAVAVGLGIRPVVELAFAPARCKAAHVRPLGVRTLEILVGDVAFLVPVVLLGDAEVDERPVPDVGKAHFGGNLTLRIGQTGGTSRFHQTPAYWSVSRTGVRRARTGLTRAE